MDAKGMGFVMAMTSYALFIVCPRMAAMTNLVSREFQFSIYTLVVLGTVLSVPLLMGMAWVIGRWGLTAGLLLAIATDLMAAGVMRAVSAKAALETLIIALFVVAGNRIAMWITAKMF